MTTSSLSRAIIPLNSISGIYFLNRVGQTLAEQGVEVVYLPQKETIASKAHGIIPSERLHQAYLDHAPENELQSVLEKYDIPSYRQLVFPQMVYDRRYDAPSYRHYWLSGTTSLDRGRYRELTHRTLDYLDVLFERGDGGVPIQFQGAEVIRRCLQRVADYHGYKSVRASFSPIPGHLLLRDTESMTFPALDSATYKELNDSEREEATNFRASVTENEDWIIGSLSDDESLAENIRRKAKRIREFGTDVGPVIADWTRRRVVKPILGNLTRRLYMDEVASRNLLKTTDYVFYPIQYYRESRLTMRAPEFYNQLWLIEFLSRSLPDDCELVVKDHPHHVGALPLTHARKITRYAHAVAPSIPARTVIKHADAVVTVNNTVGYEAIMYGKPVVTLGDAFYSGAGYTWDVATLDELATQLSNAVAGKKLSDETVLEFAHGIIESSFEGEWANEDEQNVEQFVDSVQQYLNMS